MPSTRRLALAALAFVALVSGCGPHKTPREIETGANAGEETPTPTPSVGYATNNDADAFPSIALDVPPPADTLGVDAAETAQSKAPHSPEAALNLGYAYYKQAAYDQSADVFQKAALAFSGKPTAAIAYLYAGLASMGAGDLNAAVTALDHAATAKGLSRTQQSLAYLEIGRSRFQQKRDADAKSAFEKSLELNPHQGEARLALGTYAAMDEKYGTAKPLFEQALQDLPPGRAHSKALASLGLLSEKSGNHAAAVAYYKKALAEDPKNTAAAQALASSSVASPAPSELPKPSPS